MRRAEIKPITASLGRLTAEITFENALIQGAHRNPVTSKNSLSQSAIGRIGDDSGFSSLAVRGSWGAW
jgi:hypothetical protein